MARTLSQIAAGTPAAPSANANNMLVSNPGYCSLTSTPQPTPSTTKIDLSRLIQNACGYFEMDVDYSISTASTSKIWGFGGAIATGNGTINKDLYKYPALSFAVDTDGFFDGFTKSGVTYNDAGASDYLNLFVLGYQPLLISDITFLSSGSDASYKTLSRAPFSAQALNVWGNFYQADLAFAPDLCNPCFNEDNQAIHWGIEAGISSTTPLSIVIPAGAKGTFRFCTKGYAPTNDFVDCTQG